MKPSPTVGLLAMQGAFKKHGEIINSLGNKTLEVRKPEQLEQIDGIIIPGGESTTIYKMLQKSGLFDTLKDKIENGLPVLGTCAGIILLAQRISNSDQPRLGVLNVTVERNSYGRQTESFETELEIKGLDNTPVTGIFIRAPKIKETGHGVEILSEFAGSPVLVKQDNIVAATFHPELTNDKRIHKLFTDIL